MSACNPSPLLVLAAILLLSAPATLAQQPETPGTPAPSPPASNLALPPTLADQEPYTRWKRHTGTAAEAVVVVRTEFKNEKTGETEVRQGSGFVVRCDGFVLVPSVLLLPPGTRDWARERALLILKTPSLLTFAAADASAPPPPLPAPRLAFSPTPFPSYW